jgi:ankyrin repeat protein
MTELIAAGAPLTTEIKGFWERGGTALEIAASRGDSAMVAVLLSAARWPKKAIDRALYLAAMTGKPDVLEPLFSYGPDVAYREAGDNNQTVLMSAASSGVPAVVERILVMASHFSKDGVNAQDSEGKTALIENASAYRPDADAPQGLDRAAVTDLLLKAGAEVDQQDNEGDTALIANSSFASVAAALIKGGANVNAQNKAGETALMHALYVDVAEALLKAGQPTPPTPKPAPHRHRIRRNVFSSAHAASLRAQGRKVSS